MARVWGSAGLGAPGVGVAWAGEAEHLDGTHVIRAGVEQPAQLAVQDDGAGGGVEGEEAVGEGAALGGPFAVQVAVSSAAPGGWCGAATGASRRQVAWASSCTTRLTAGSCRQRDWSRVRGPHSSSNARSSAQPAGQRVAGPHGGRHGPQMDLGVGSAASRSKVPRRAGSSGITTTPAPPLRPGNYMHGRDSVVRV
jgi:hypothetical protein